MSPACYVHHRFRASNPRNAFWLDGTEASIVPNGSLGQQAHAHHHGGLSRP